MVKLNLGAGDKPLSGYLNLDRKSGDEIYPLARFVESSAEEIRASHVLEHFSHHEVPSVLRDWVRVLAPGGLLKIAVPDFAKIAQGYLDGEQMPVQGYVMGGQTDESDYHKAIFDEDALRKEMEAAGLTGITSWKSELADCASLPISLNLMGIKPEFDAPHNEHSKRGNLRDFAKETHDKAILKEFAAGVGVAISMRRLAFTDNYFSAMNGFSRWGINMRKQTGAFWGQSLEKSIDQWLDDGVKWILTMDHDTIFVPQDVADLMQLAIDHPAADAIAPIQAHRIKPTPLMTIKNLEGEKVDKVEMGVFDAPMLRIHTAHFGLTLINADKIREMPRPLFWSKPGPTGRWDEEREDDDIYFWKRWEEAGNSLYLANRVTVGHAELMIRWPNEKLQAQYQHTSEFWAEPGGVKPDWVWK